jgi:hypothetical protein
VDDARALYAAEQSVHNALRTLTTENAPGVDQVERDVYTDMARRMAFKAVGGSTNMQIGQRVDEASLSDPKSWSV